jgi:hypothetical protein
MRIEIIIFGITALIIANVYTDGKYLKLIQTNQKYVKMGGIALGGLMLYILLKKFPDRAKNIISSSNEYMKYLPVDSGTASMVSPILDFTSKQNVFNDSQNSQTYNHPVLNMTSNGSQTGGSRSDSSGANSAETRLLNSGKNSSKRSVSETKKKFVASRQGWKCGDCGNQLSAWFEVDHKIRLEHGGSNHVDNLVALCRECHGCKTAMENL